MVCGCNINGFAFPPPKEATVTPWGWWIEHFCADDYSYRSKTLCIECGHQISVQYHKERSELWYIPQENGYYELTLGEEKSILRGKRKIDIPVGFVHSIKNMSSIPLIIYETQYGKRCSESDIVRIHDPYADKR